MSRMRDDDFPKLKYTSDNRKPAEFERWVQLMTMKVSSAHPTVRDFWQVVQLTASAAYDQYLYLGPMQKSLARPDTAAVPLKYTSVEMRIRPLVLSTLPASVQSMALSTRQSTVVELLYAAMVDAGPGTKRDRETLHKAVAATPAAGAKEAFNTLQVWKFDLQRLVRLGMQPPDPSLQAETLRAMVKKMAEQDQAFQYRLHAYQMNTGMFGMVTQQQVDEFWKFLSSEAREVQGCITVDAKALAVKGGGKGDPKGGGKGQQGGGGKGQPGKGDGKGKAGKGGQPDKDKDKDKDKKKQTCKFYQQDGGCSKGGQCGFEHPKLSIKDGRCFNCGASGHQTRECPRPRAQAKAAPAIADGHAATPAATTTPVPATSGSASTAQAQGGGQSAQAQAAQIAAATVKALLQTDWSDLQNLQAKVARAKTAHVVEEGLILADSGASHEVRALTGSAPADARPVELQLAAGAQPGWLGISGTVPAQLANMTSLAYLDIGDFPPNERDHAPSSGTSAYGRNPYGSLFSGTLPPEVLSMLGMPGWEDGAEDPYDDPPGDPLYPTRYDDGYDDSEADEYADEYEEEEEEEEEEAD